MDGYSVTYATGRLHVDEVDAVFAPRSQRVGRCGAVLLHGYSNVPASFHGAQCFVDATTALGGTTVAATLASHGIPCVAAQFGDNLWGNDGHLTRIDAAWDLLMSMFDVAPDRICLYGISMGAAAAARYATVNPTKVAAGYGTAPVSNITDMYVNNRANAQTSIGTAWGISYPVPLPSGADLPGRASLAASVPWRLDYGTADTVVQPSTVTTLAATWGPNCTATVIDTSLAHSDALFAKTDPLEVLSFFVANGA